jgi:ferredoxin-NADP reductase
MKHTVTLVDKKIVAKDTMAFHFSKPEGFTFKAGQSIDLFLINPSETDAEGNKRAFSLAGAPYLDTLMITTRMRDTAFKRVLKNAPIGSELELDGPFGSFTLHNDVTKPAIFLTGGIGITPAHSIIQQSSHDQSQHILFLFYSNHTPEETAFLDEFQNLQSQNSNFSFIPTMTQADNTSWKGKTERISKEMLAEYIHDLTSPIYYICGPAGMVATMKQLLLDAGVNEDNIRTEDFPGY